MDEMRAALDDEQAVAVYSDAKRLLVLAPPGSGKTRTLAYRFARLVNEGAQPREILAITFTIRAAEEMRQRILSLVRVDASQIVVGTFHSFCLRLIESLGQKVKLYGRADTIAFFRKAGAKNPVRAASRVSSVKNGALASSEDETALFNDYQAHLIEARALDLDDLVPEAIRLMEQGVDGMIKPTHILVDEYQDINPAQERLLKLLLKPESSLFVIGDPDQAIYSFRGACLENILNFEANHPRGEVLRLDKNYRSTGNIVFASSSLIQNNVKRLYSEARPHRRDGEVIRIVECNDAKAHSGFIVKEIEAMMGGLSSLTASASGVRRFSDFAVLFRTHRQADELVKSFSKSVIPYQYVNNAGDDIGAVIALLKGAVICDDENVAGFVRARLREAGIERCPTLPHLCRYAERAGKDALRAFIEETLLMEEADNLDIVVDKVSLMSIHSAKGLEFPVVFIVGADDGVMPLRFKNSASDVEEERRLFYVAMTRAKDALYITREGKEPSLFLDELGPSSISRIKIEKKKTIRRMKQNALFGDDFS
ncbi:MAG: ATP-dependent helicase [Deltaproteobacteria bacterium]|nr:ATP-dependent helicase [Deltaproteobacteria bacterium]